MSADEVEILGEGVVRDRLARGEPGEAAEKPFRVGLRVLAHHLDGEARSGGRGADRQVAEEDAVRGRRPRLGRERTLDFEPLDRRAAMALGRHGRKVVEKAAVGADEGHGQAQQAVFEGLARFEMNLGLKDLRPRQQIHPAAGLAHVAGDIGTRGLPRAEAHRLRLVGGDEPEVRHLPHRPGGEAHAVGAVAFRPEPARIAKVGPGRGAEDGHLQAFIAPLFGRHLLVFGLRDGNHHVVAGEEHGLPVAEGVEGRKKIGPGSAEFLHGGRLHAGGDRLGQRGFGGVEPAFELHARDIEHLRHLREAVRLAVGRQLVANVELRKLEKIAQLILELVAVEAAHWPAPVFHHLGPVGFSQTLAQRGDKGGALFPGEIMLLLRRRHFALLDAVEEANPAVAILWVGRTEIESEEIEISLHRDLVVTVGAMVLDGGADGPGHFRQSHPPGRGGAEEEKNHECRVFHGYLIVKREATVGFP